jgi:hypothetical protein
LRTLVLAIRVGRGQASIFPNAGSLPQLLLALTETLLAYHNA